MAVTRGSNKKNGLVVEIKEYPNIELIGGDEMDMYISV